MFQETQPLELEFFGGIDSSTPPNDLPPFSAVTARNCVFPQSGVGSRPGFSNLAAIGVADASSIVLVATRNGAAIARQLVVASRSGPAKVYQIDTPSTADVHALRFATDHLATATQFYQRAVLCHSGSDGYGDFASILGDGGYSVLRFSAPGAPTASPVGSGGACTAGLHYFALTCNFVDGTESPLGAGVSATTVIGGRVDLSWTATTLPTSNRVSTVSVWATTAGAPTEFRRFLTVSPSTTTAVFDLSDEILQKKELVATQPTYRSPRYPALAVEYGGRLAYFGERHKAVASRDMGGSQGTDFGGGDILTTSGVPGGWTLVSGAGHAMRGGVALIQFDGVTATRARLRNVGTVLNDLPGIAQGTGPWTASFGVRVIYYRNDLATSGGLKFGVTGTTGSTDQTIDLSTKAAETLYVSELIVSGTFSNDVKLFFEGIGPGVNGGELFVLALECFDPTNTSHRSTVWWSEPYQMRAIDSFVGGQTFGTSDSETAWLGFEWQGRFYVAKDSSLWVTSKTDGAPTEWPVEKVSDLIGACGRRAIGHGPDFKVLVNRGGCWLFQGAAIGTDGNLAREIPVEWAAINWAEAWQIDVAVDDLAQRIYLAVPTGTSTHNDSLYVLDYSGGLGPATQIGGRRWSVWPIEARGICVGRRAGATQPELWIARGSGGSVSWVNYLDPATTSDYPSSAPISWEYETGKIGAGDGALGLFRKVVVVAVGSGLLVPTLVKSDGGLVVLPAQTLYSPTRGAQHVLCNVKDERVGLRFGLSGAGAKVHLHRAALWMRRNPFGPYRVLTP